MSIDEALNLAAKYFQAGQITEASAICRQILGAVPDHPSALNLVGMMLGSRGEHAQAAGVFARLAAVCPTIPEAHANLGLALQMSGRLDAAAAACRRALQLQPNFLDALITLGNVLQSLSAEKSDVAFLDEAIVCFKKATLLRRDWPAAHFNLANALARRGRNHEAAAAYQQALALSPNDASAQNNYALALQSLGRLQEAATVFHQAITLDPNDWRAMNNLGTVLEDLQQWDQAVTWYSQVMALQPDLSEAHKNLAHALYGGGRLDEAFEAYGRILTRWPADPEPHFNMSRIVLAQRSAATSLDLSIPDLPRLPYLGDKVVLLDCDRPAREQLRTAGLHGGYLIDPETGVDQWLLAQLHANHSPEELDRLLTRWLAILRDEAAVSGTTAAVWMPDMPSAFRQAFIRLIADALIDIPAASAHEIHAALCARAIQPPDTADKIWAMVSIRNGGLELLPHWLEHYTTLGCDQLLIGVFDDVPRSDLDELERCRQRWNFTTFSQKWGLEGEEFQYGQRRSICQRAGALPSTWIINTDLDEFHIYPAPLRQVLDAAAAIGSQAIAGQFVDRAAADGSFPTIRPEPPIWEQFPIECDITHRICRAQLDKVMASRFGVRVNAGHHVVLNEKQPPPPLGESKDYKVAHFKWHGKLVERMRWALDQPNASRVWKRETRRFLDWLDRNGGRINLAEVRGAFSPQTAAAEESYHAARRQFRAGELNAAQESAHQALLQFPQRADLLNLTGMITYQLGQRDQAVDFFQKATAADPANADYHFNLGRVLHAMERWSAATAAYRAVLALRPNDGLANKNLAMVLHFQGQVGEAIEFYQRSLALEPNDYETLTNLAGAFSDRGLHTQAMDCYRKALVLKPDSAPIYNSFGLALSLSGNPEEAVTAFRRALELKPDYTDVHKNLALALNKTGRLGEGYAVYKRLLSLVPGDMEAFWCMCRLWLPLAEMTQGKSTSPPEQKLPYLGDKVVLLHCDRATREQLRRAGLHGGHLTDSETGADLWLAAQATADLPADILERNFTVWLDNLRNEAAMSAATATLWLPQMPQHFIEIFRRAAGNNLIEPTATTAPEIFSQLSSRAVPPPDTARKTWAIVSIRNGGLELLPHWLEHYTNLGCDRLLVGVFDDVPRSGLDELDRCRQRWNFQTFPQQWGTGSDEIQYSQRRTACRLAGALPTTWIINTDLDEFHEYPLPLPQILDAAAQNGRRAIWGNFVDRVAADGSFPSVAAQPSLWEQFPIECNISKRICLALPRKVMASCYSVRINPGHHDANETIHPPAVGKVPDYRVHHFKWHGGVIDRMRWSLSQPNAPSEWKLEARRFLDWLDRGGGKINLSDPVIAAVNRAIHRAAKP